jgi:hypothetical protein
MVSGIDIESKDLMGKTRMCESCIFGKHNRKPFKSTDVRSTRPLEIVHSDVCGPFQEKTHDNCRYFVTFMDDFTHFVTLYLIRHKSEVFEKFKEYNAMATAHFGLKISRLRRDNGTEYTSKEFLSFCKSQGIIVEPTVAYTPEQNGVSERLNRTLVEKARTMMIESGVSNELWGEAILCATYLTNRSPCSVYKEKETPYERWFKKKPDLSKLKIFGCVAFAHIPKEKRKKLDKKSRKCRFVGYVVNGYKLWDLEARKIIIARDVIFDESVMKIETCGSIEEDDLYYNIHSKNVEENQDLWEDNSGENREENNSTEPSNNDENSLINDLNDDTLEDDYESDDLDGTLVPQTETEPEQPIRQSTREKKIPNWHNSYHMGFLNEALLTEGSVDGIPQTIHELQKRDDWNLWKKAIDEELDSMKDNDVWEFVDKLPNGRKAINSKWVFVIKRGENGKDRYKARLVAKGCSQKAGIDYKETFAPVVKIATIRIMLSYAVYSGLHIEQMDVKTAFLNGNLGEEVYMKLSLDGNGQSICKLKKSIYGLKQSSRNWNSKFDSVMQKLGFKAAKADPCLYILKDRELFILLYVDDCMILGKSMDDIRWVKKELFKSFEMKDLGKMETFLGMEIAIDNKKGTVEISHRQYIEKLLKRFGMEDSNPCGTPMDPGTKLKDSENHTDEPYRELIGSLQYLALMTRPDIAVAVNMLGRYQSQPGKEHFMGLKRILRYLKGTMDYKLEYTRKDKCCLEGFADADFANDEADRKSVSGYIFKVYGNTVSWSTKKQATVSLSSTEAEFIALSHAAKEGVWIRKLLDDIGTQSEQFTIHEDNIPCIKISDEPREHQRMKHIDTKYMFVRELIKDRKIKLEYIATGEQQADIMTKPVNKLVLIKHLKNIGLN